MEGRQSLKGTAKLGSSTAWTRGRREKTLRGGARGHWAL